MSQDLPKLSNGPPHVKESEDRYRILEELRLSEERFRLLVQGVKDYAIFMLLPDGTIASWNEGAERAKGYKAAEIIGKHFSVFYPPEDRARGRSQELLRIAVDQGRVEDEGWRVRKDGSRFWADVVLTALKDENGVLRGFAKVTRDVTERKRAEQLLEEKQRQITELQKMEAIGRLAGGIAHDFNNLISGIVGCAEALESSCAQDPEQTEEVREIQKACERASLLTRQLMAFSRRQIASPVVLDPNHEINELKTMLSRLIGAQIQMDMRLSPDAGSVKMDPSQFQQIVVNLVLNARDAMPNGGRLFLYSKRITIDDLANTQDFTIAQGEYVMLMIGDTGTGMSPEIRQHIFEPFFTTKPVGKGTGLGLATVYGVAQQNGGSIAVFSSPGLGTAFKIFMPVHSEGPEGKRPSESASTSDADLIGNQTILVVEDDPLVLRNVVRSLQARGYTVLSAPHGEQALALAQKLEGKIDLVLTDVIMPGMNGKELAEKMRQADPGLRVLFMSGFSADLIAEHGLLKQDVNFIEKPFTSLALAQKLRKILKAQNL